MHVCMVHVGVIHMLLTLGKPGAVRESYISSLIGGHTEEVTIGSVCMYRYIDRWMGGVCLLYHRLCGYMAGRSVLMVPFVWLLIKPKVYLLKLYTRFTNSLIHILLKRVYSFSISLLVIVLLFSVLFV